MTAAKRERQDAILELVSTCAIGSQEEPIATVHRDGDVLEVPREGGGNRWRELFGVRDGTLFIDHRLMPSMLTRSVAAVRQDCLCYLMERLPLPG